MPASCPSPASCTKQGRAGSGAQSEDPSTLFSQHPSGLMFLWVEGWNQERERKGKIHVGDSWRSRRGSPEEHPPPLGPWPGCGGGGDAVNHLLPSPRYGFTFPRDQISTDRNTPNCVWLFRTNWLLRLVPGERWAVFITFKGLSLAAYLPGCLCSG